MFLFATLSPAKRAWLTGAAIATAMWAFAFACCDVRFATNDDQFLLRSFAAIYPSGSPSFHLFLSTLVAYPLSLLGNAFPGVAWLTYLEIALIWLSTATLTKSIIQCCHRSRRAWLGVALAVCFALLFVLRHCARLTFTMVSALLGAACVAQILSVDCEKSADGPIVRSMAYALLLLVACYALREEVALPALAFSGVAFLYRFFTCFVRKRSWRPMVRAAVLVAVVMGLLFVGREVEINLRGQRDYVTWQQARSSVQDYINLGYLPPESREITKWSEQQTALLGNWYTMDEAYSTDVFQYVAHHYSSAQTRTSPGAAVFDFRMRSPLITLSLVVLFGVGAMCLAGLIWHKSRLWTLLALGLTAAGCLMMLAYLAIQGRLPYRAVMVPVLPAAAIVFCLIPECLPRQKRWFLPCFLAALIAGTAACAVPTVQEIWYKEPEWDYNTHAAMDDIATQNPDLLFIFSNELVNDLRAFPDFSDGLPMNLSFWGGWQRGSAEYASMMAAFGLDGEHFTAADWLHPAIRFLTLKEEPDATLTQYLRDELGESLTWEKQKMDEALYAYRFYLAN